MVATLIVGLGSPHGDDQVGWLVADLLRKSVALEQPADCHVRRGVIPLDVLDWLDGVQHLVVCDACLGTGSAGKLHRWNWPDAAITQCRSTGSHDFALPDVLALAETLGVLPRKTTIWGIEIAADSSCPSPALDDIATAAATAICDAVFQGQMQRPA